LIAANRAELNVDDNDDDNEDDEDELEVADEESTRDINEAEDK
jgi:hypothetical protein